MRLKISKTLRASINPNLLALIKKNVTEVKIIFLCLNEYGNIILLCLHRFLIANLFITLEAYPNKQIYQVRLYLSLSKLTVKAYVT